MAKRGVEKENQGIDTQTRKDQCFNEQSVHNNINGVLDTSPSNDIVFH